MHRAALKLFASALATTLFGIGVVNAGPSAGPHLSGDEYIALRAGSSVPIVNFVMEISSSDGDKRYDVELGPDFAVRKSSANTTVFDFRFQRLLHIQNSEPEFDNTSLYGHAISRFFRVYNNLAVFTQMRRAQRDDMQTPGLQRFLVEHMSGLRIPAPEFTNQMPIINPQITHVGGRTVGRVEDTTVFTVEYGDVVLPSADHRKTFAAWLALAVRMHPQIASVIASENILPTYLELAEPGAALISRTAEPLQRQIIFSDFSVSAGQLETVQGMEATSPAWPPLISSDLASLMVQAATGTALDGPRTDADYVKEIDQLLNDEKIFDALMLALHATQPYDNCRGDDVKSMSPELCAITESVFGKAGDDLKGQSYIAAVQSSNAGNHLNAAQIFILLRGDDVLRPDILEMFIANEVIEARNKSQRSRLMDEEFEKLPERFQKAFEADPYNPHRYQIFYKYLLSAASAPEQKILVDTKAHAVGDLARMLPDRRMPKSFANFVSREQQLEQMLPVLLPFPEHTR